MGKGGGNNRFREMDVADRGSSKTSNVKLKGLQWDTKAAQPAFLRNTLSALSGPQASTSTSTSTSADGRPSIPERPSGEADEESEEDEWDFGRGEEAPSVVVLKEGRHLDREEVDRMRAQAKSGDAPDPLATSSAPTKTKNSGSLAIASTSSANKRKVSEADGVEESWEDVIKRSKLATEEKAASVAAQKEEEAKAKEKAEKKKRKEKKDQKKKVGMLSFAD